MGTRNEHRRAGSSRRISRRRRRPKPVERRGSDRRCLLGSSLELLVVNAQQVGGEGRLPVLNISEGGCSFLRPVPGRRFGFFGRRPPQLEADADLCVLLHVPPYSDSLRVRAHVSHVGSDAISGAERVGVTFAGCNEDETADELVRVMRLVRQQRG